MKHDPESKIALELIKLVAGSEAFHLEFKNMIVDVQALISSYSLNQISLSSTPWTWK